MQYSRQYPTIFTALHPLFHDQSLPNTTDNAAGAVARLILAHPNAVPLDQVLPVFFTALPLKADFAENEPVFACLFQLFQSNNALVGSPCICKFLFTSLIIHVNLGHEQYTAISPRFHACFV